MRYGVDIDFETEGTIQTYVEASSPTEARVKACKKAKEELMSTSVLGPRHTYGREAACRAGRAGLSEERAT